MLLAIVLVATTTAAGPADVRASGRPPTFGYPLADAVFAAAISAGPDGNMWFVAGGAGQPGQTLGRVTPSGEVTEFNVPVGIAVQAITTGPDGNLWLTGANGIARATPSAEVAVFPLSQRRSNPSAIAAGPDGNLWFTEGAASRIGRITTERQDRRVPAAHRGNATRVGSPPGPMATSGSPRRGAGRDRQDHQRREDHRVPHPGRPAKPQSIALGADDNLWFGDAATPRIGRITPSGAVTMFPVPTETGTDSVVAGADGLIWFAAGYEIGAIGPDGAVSWPACLSERCQNPALALAAAPDGSIWASSGIGHCLGLCGGGTEISYQFDPGGIGPYSLRPLGLAIGPRPTLVRRGRTSVTVACGEDAGCRGVLRLGLIRYPHGKRHFRVVARSGYDLGPGEAGRIPLRLAGAALRPLGGGTVYALATAGPRGRIDARRGVELVLAGAGRGR